MGSAAQTVTCSLATQKTFRSRRRRRRHLRRPLASGRPQYEQSDRQMSEWTGFLSHPLMLTRYRPELEVLSCWHCIVESCALLIVVADHSSNNNININVEMYRSSTFHAPACRATQSNENQLKSSPAAFFFFYQHTTILYNPLCYQAVASPRWLE